MGLLVFVVVVGLPMVGVPSLRNRLSTRVMALKSALSGEIKPATLAVGSNHEPFPAEYERPVPPAAPVQRFQRAPETSKADHLFTMNGDTITPTEAPARPAAGKTSKRGPAESASKAGSEQAESQPSAPSGSSSGENDLKYQKGKAEQQAYDMLLKSNPALSGLIQGKDPSLKFKSWDAASRGEDTYWVRLIFHSEGTADSEYIWQVKIQSNQVTPLNYNARNFSQ